ncbi:hypothetical protein HMPREF9374_2096 [Desmospora sp. 8437]|nr:hypothetical protein HMPREF9374_2096 [Desmospora sp. 8437]
MKGAAVYEEVMSPLAPGSELWYNWNWIGKTIAPVKGGERRFF